MFLRLTLSFLLVSAKPLAIRVVIHNNLSPYCSSHKLHTQPEQDVRTTLYERCFNVLTSFQRPCDVVLMSCVCWVKASELKHWRKMIWNWTSIYLVLNMKTTTIFQKITIFPLISKPKPKNRTHFFNYHRQNFSRQQSKKQNRNLQN